MNIMLGLLMVRIGIGCVFLLFGFDKLAHPGNWVIYIPAGLADSGGHPLFNIHNALRVQGLVELMIGIHLLAGLKVRIAAGVSAIILLLIIIVLGWDPIAIRDFGLLGACVGLCILGGGPWSLDAWLAKDNKNHE